MPNKRRLIRTITIPQIADDCWLYFAQHPTHIPFKIKRVYYIVQANTKLKRGLHAHKRIQQVIFCIQGTIKLLLDNGIKKEEVLLDEPNVGVFLDRMVWHEMYEFKKNTILLVLASEGFNEKDYIRSYEEFKRRIKVS